MNKLTLFEAMLFPPEVFLQLFLLIFRSGSNTFELLVSTNLEMDSWMVI